MAEKTANPCRQTFDSAGALPKGWQVDIIHMFADGTDARDYRVLCPLCSKRWGDVGARGDEFHENSP